MYNLIARQCRLKILKDLVRLSVLVTWREPKPSHHQKDQRPGGWRLSSSAASFRCGGTAAPQGAAAGGGGAFLANPRLPLPVPASVKFFSQAAASFFKPKRNNQNFFGTDN
jgi:hypothetical protein